MPKLQVSLPEAGEVTHELIDETITVGRLPDNNIQIDDVSVSSHHLQLTLSGGDYTLKDLNSTNGTRINGQSVTESQLRAGDKVRIGKVEAVYQSDVPVSDADKRELPAAELASATAASSSARPANFSNSSPFTVKKTKTDPAGKAVFMVMVVGIVAFLAAMAYIFMMQVQLPS